MFLHMGPGSEAARGNVLSHSRLEHLLMMTIESRSLWSLCHVRSDCIVCLIVLGPVFRQCSLPKVTKLAPYPSHSSSPFATQATLTLRSRILLLLRTQIRLLYTFRTRFTGATLPPCKQTTFYFSTILLPGLQCFRPRSSRSPTHHVFQCSHSKDETHQERGRPCASRKVHHKSTTSHA